MAEKRLCEARRGRGALLGVAAVGVALMASAPGRAVAEEAPDFATPGAYEASIDPREGTVHWRESWPRFRTWEYVATGALLAEALAVRFLAPRPELYWNSGILFDDAVIDALAVRDDPARARWVLASDISLYVGLGVMVADVIVVAGLIHDDWDVALQLFMMDLQAVSAVMATLWTSQLAAGRARPLQRQCDDPAFAELAPECDPDNPERNRSFIAGHPAIALAAAGLTCTHHAHIPLYGEGPWGGIMCGALIASATVNGFARLIAEKHYASDLILGLALGGVAGWVLPRALHYGFSADDALDMDAAAPPPMLAPMVDGERVGLVLLGVF